MAIVGIDLGTTNSLVAVLEDGGPRLIKNALGQLLTSSAVSIASDGTVLVGTAASDRLITDPTVTIASFKRLMGSGQVVKLGKNSFRPEELSSLVLRSLKADAEAELGEPVTEAVISVPAYFNDFQRKATLDAGRLAGLKVDRLVNEPTAAALAYGLGKQGEGKYLVFDLGGGTFDVSILEKYEGVMEIHATTGDTHLGGNDFTQILEHLIASAAKVDVSVLERGDRARLNREAEKAKVALTSATEMDYAFQLQGKSVSGKLTRPEFEGNAAALLQRLRHPTERAILDARLKPDDFNAVVLIGGATRMPMVRSLVARMFGRLPLINIDPDTTVALGAAVQAGLHKRAAALDDVVMTDVCPYTLGIEVVDDRTIGTVRVSPIIERNAVVPISRTERFCTAGENQTYIAVKVYQGENLRPDNNVHLGTIEVPVPKAPAGKEAIDVCFTYDINGALQVEVTAITTQKVVSQVMRNTLGLTEDELKARFEALQDLKLHPREQMANKTLLARAERLYSEHLSPEREEILALMHHFQEQISDQQLRDKDTVRQAFEKALDRFERSPFGVL